MKTILVALSLLAYSSVNIKESCDQLFPKINDTPVVGILGIPPDPSNPENQGYIQANYVKYLEMGGARVIPLFSDHSMEQLKASLRLLNGVLLTGGGTYISYSHSNLLTPYGEAVQAIVEHSQLQMEEGRYFPVWGTCLGYQAILTVVTNHTKVIGNSNVKYASLKLNFTEEAKNSRLFKNLDPALAAAVSEKHLTYHEHEKGIPLSYFNDDSFGLSKFFNLLGTAVDLDNIPIVSVIEHKTLPIYGVAFHPEKPIFDFAPGYNIPHAEEAQAFSRYLAQFFASEAKRSELTITSQDALSMKIENYPLTILEGYMGEEYRFK